MVSIFIFNKMLHARGRGWKFKSTANTCTNWNSVPIKVHNQELLDNLSSCNINTVIYKPERGKPLRKGRLYSLVLFMISRAHHVWHIRCHWLHLSHKLISHPSIILGMKRFLLRELQGQIYYHMYRVGFSDQTPPPSALHNLWTALWLILWTTYCSHVISHISNM